MDSLERSAVLALGEREAWTLDDLPQAIDLDMLRRLDDLGLIEVLFRYWQSHTPTLQNPATRVEGQLGWFSPLLSPTTGGTWTQVWEHHRKQPDNLPYKVRLNDRGWAARARASRKEVAEPPSNTVSKRSRRPAGAAPVRSFTVKELEKAIRDYRQEHVAEYAALKAQVAQGDRRAWQRARELFGRNALVRALGVKSAAMVSKTAVWKSIRADLRLHKQSRASRVPPSAQATSTQPTVEAVCDAELSAVLTELGRRGDSLRQSWESGAQTREQVWETLHLLRRDGPAE